MGFHGRESIGSILDKSPGFVVDPLIDVRIMAAGMRHEHIFHPGQLRNQSVVLMVKAVIKTFQFLFGSLKIMDPHLLLLTTFGCSNPVTLEEAIAPRIILF